MSRFTSMQHIAYFRTVLGIAISAFCVSFALAAETVDLSSLDLSKTSQGYGTPQVNKSVMGNPLMIGGNKYEQGLGTHAVSVLRIDLSGGTERFTASVGVDDETGSQQASIAFQVIGDGRILWDSGVMKCGQPAKEVDLELKGIQTLILLATDAQDGNNSDHADWADAKFAVTGQKPTTIAPPRGEPVILTPKPEATPRINGPKVFGVRPGRPLLFTIPATGQRPMEFSVEGSPQGISVDSRTGQLSGSIKQPGRYTMTLQAKNSLGQAERQFTVVCGDTIALTPHMGWNSWYIWGGDVTDKVMRDAADAMVSTDMINHGYSYVNIDDCWAVNLKSINPGHQGEPRNARGYVNANKSFPDMKGMTDYIHRRGLKAGIYTSPGPLTCAGCTGSYQHENQDAQRFAEWGFDFLKYDLCSYGELIKDPSSASFRKPYELMWDELKKQDRDIVLNLCEYGMGDVAQWGGQVGNSWRTAGDLGSPFEAISTNVARDGFDLFGRNTLQQYNVPGAWNDPDYLLLGHIWNHNPTPLTYNEQYSHMTLWCLLAAPLILGGDINDLDAFTLNLLCNDEVLEVDQDPLGKSALRVAKTGDLEVWAKDMEDGSKAVGLFNRGEYPQTVAAKWSDLGLSGKQAVRDLWRQKDQGIFDNEFSASVEPRGVILVRIQATK